MQTLAPSQPQRSLMRSVGRWAAVSGRCKPRRYGPWGKLLPGWAEWQAHGIRGLVPAPHGAALHPGCLWTLLSPAGQRLEGELVSKPEDAKNKSAFPEPLPWED